MHSILHCTHPEAHEIRRSIHDTLQQLADALLQDPNVRTSPLLVNIVHYVTDSCRDYAHPSIVWLGTWNLSILRE